MMTESSWKVLASHNAFDHSMVRRTARYLCSSRMAPYRDDLFHFGRPDVVVVVAVDRSGQMIIVRQYSTVFAR